MSYTHLAKLLRDLKVIGRIEENGRLSTTGRNTVSIESDSMLQPFWRAILGDSRERGAESITSVVSAVIEISEQLIESHYLAKDLGAEMADVPEDYRRAERDKVIE